MPRDEETWRGKVGKVMVELFAGDDRNLEMVWSA